MIVYNKLVRDRIPEIVAADGKVAKTRVLELPEYEQALGEKLGEELDEYRKIGDTAELADMVDVILALAAVGGLDESAFYELVLLKRSRQGSFKDRLFLECVD